MENCRKDFQRTPNIGQGIWKNAEKISNELLKSARVNGKNAEKVRDELRILGWEDGKMLKRFPTNFEDLSQESFPNIDSKKGIWAFGALRLLGRNGPKTPKPQTPKPLPLNLYLD